MATLRLIRESKVFLDIGALEKDSGSMKLIRLKEPVPVAEIILSISGSVAGG